jgi:RimJ/RimL family protein N-acetyltransferase
MLTGKLTRLRALDPADLDRYVSWLNDPEVTQYLYNLPLVSRLAESDWLDRQARKEPAFGDVTLAIETFEGRHIGSVALHDPRPRDRHCSLGIMIGDKECWDHGYGTDAIAPRFRRNEPEPCLAHRG